MSDGPTLELDWPAAEAHLQTCLNAYGDLVGQPGVNPWFALGALTALKNLLEASERTPALYAAIMEFAL